MSNRTGEQLAALERLLHLYQVKAAVLSMPAGRLHEFPEEVRKEAGAAWMKPSESNLTPRIEESQRALVKSGYSVPLNWAVEKTRNLSVDGLRLVCGEIQDACLQLRLTPPAQEALALDDKGTSFQPAKDVREYFKIADQKTLQAILQGHPEIRRRRPLTKDGKEDPHRLEVHLGDMAEAMKWNGTVSPAGELPDPMDLPAEYFDKVESALAGIKSRKAEVDTKRRNPAGK